MSHDRTDSTVPSRRGVLSLFVRSSAAAAVAAAAAPELAKPAAADPLAPIAPAVTNPDAALIELGERLKAAIAQAEALHPDRALYDEAWQASGLDGGPTGKAHKAALRRFSDAREKNGYAAAYEKWNAACDVEAKIARSILAMPAQTRIGDGIRAAAEIVQGNGLYVPDSLVLWESAARAGFVLPPDIAKDLKRKGRAPAKSKPDPIFAAIERCRIADAEHGEACKHEPAFDSSEYPAWEAKGGAACERYARAVRRFCSTAPTTFAGIAAALRFVEQQEETGLRNGTAFLAIYRTKGGRETCHGLFLASMRKAAERLGMA